jgi:hypothetical protein
MCQSRLAGLDNMASGFACQNKPMMSGRDYSCSARFPRFLSVPPRLRPTSLLTWHSEPSSEWSYTHTRRCSDTSMPLAHMASLTPSSSSSSPPHHAAAASWGGTHGEEAREGPPHVPAATSAPSPCRSDAAHCCWPEARTWGSASLRSSPTPARGPPATATGEWDWELVLTSTKTA